MRISRIFRKYSRILLLIFMSLLLVVFLIGDVISRAQRSYAVADREIGRAFGEPVRLSHIRHAEADFEVAGQLGVRWPPVNASDQGQANLAMHLLLEEARRAGVRVGRDQIVQSLRNAPGASMVLSAIRDQTGRSLNSIYDSVARVSATKLLARYQLEAAAGASLPQLEHAYRDQNQEARVLISVVDAKGLLSQVPTPTEEELQAHFEEGKDREDAHTEETLVHGYRIPDRVQLEYLTVDASAIQDRVRVSEKKVERYYEDNKQKYMKTVEETSPPGLEDQQPQEVQMTYEEVKDRVREDYRVAKAVREAQALVNLIQQEALRPWVAAPVGEGGVRQAPPDDALVPFSELQARFSSEYPVIYKKTELLTELELRRERGFGRATLVIDRRRVPVATLALHVEGLATASEDDPTPVLRINEPSPVVLGGRSTAIPTAGATADQAYVFRVIRVEGSGPPASLDDVREKVVTNVQRCKAFELAGEQAPALAERARQAGLVQAVAEADALKAMLSASEEGALPEPVAAPGAANRYVRMLEPFAPTEFTRRPRPFQNVGYSPGLHEKVFALAEEGRLEVPEAHRVVVAPLARNLRWAVVELLEVRPIYHGEFEMKRKELEQEVTQSDVQAFYLAWFDAENILSRAGYVPATEIEP